MPTLSMNYAASAAVTLGLTTTPLGDGNWWQSAVVDNGTNLYIDATLGGSIQVGATVVDGGTIDIFLYGDIDGTVYTGGASGSDAAYTADGEELLLVDFHTIVIDATANVDYVWGPRSVREAFGVMPKKWGVVVQNNTGGALHGTGSNNTLDYYGIKYTSA